MWKWNHNTMKPLGHIKSPTGQIYSFKWLHYENQALDPSPPRHISCPNPMQGSTRNQGAASHTHNHPTPHLWPPEPWPWLPLERWVFEFPAGGLCPPGPRPQRNIPCSTPNHQTPETLKQLPHTCNHLPLHLRPPETWPWLCLERSP